MSNDYEAQIDAEVQRRLGQRTIQQNQEIANLREIISDCHGKLIQQHGLIVQLTSDPVVYTTLLDYNRYPDPAAFRPHDEVVLLVDREGAKAGKIISGLNGDPIIDNDGRVRVKLTDDQEDLFGIGLEGKAPAEVALAKKPDGTSAVVAFDGRAWEVKGVPQLDVAVGDTVKVNPANKAIIGKSLAIYNTGSICRVVAIVGNKVEVLAKGEVVQVFNPHKFLLEEGDRVLCDANMFCILEKLAPDSRDRYKVSTDLNVMWDDIGGLDEAKQELRDVLELPFMEPALFEHYGVAALRGFLIYGPPGCGKTLLARAAAVALAKQHGRTAVDSGYIYVKSPEILDKWVGNTEAEIRALFEKGRRHCREHGYKAMLVFDEADAIMPQRGTRRSSDVADTIVPMFLGEMDGVDPKQTLENPIVVLLTNRADILDPAIIRDGRISKKIKVGRPTEITGIDILDIHSKKVPFSDPTKRMQTLAIATSDLFAKTKTLYTVNGQHAFTLGDAVNGAMIEAMVETAKMIALHRDIKNKSCTGVTMEDFRAAIKKIYEEQRGLNHTYDLHDFAERHQLQPSEIEVKRSFGSA